MAAPDDAAGVHTARMGAGSYTGSIRDGMAHGEGVLTMDSGDVWTGTFVCDHGLGQVVGMWRTGSSYVGAWADSQMHGTGTYTDVSGEVYSGEFVANQRTGPGTATYADGATYTGEWLENQRSGAGLYSGEWTYNGAWLFDRRHGRGHCTYASGNVYDGLFERGKREGHGEWTLVSGEHYVGNWHEDKRSGTGRWSNARGVHDGQWRAGQTHGPGVLTHANGGVMTGSWADGSLTGHGSFVGPAHMCSYLGQYVDGVRHGAGKLTHPNGDTIEGGFVDGLPRGRCVKTFVSGDVYDGDVVNQTDMPALVREYAMHGHGTFSCHHGPGTGTVYTGGLALGEFCGFGRLTYADGGFVEGLFRRSRPVVGVSTDAGGVRHEVVFSYHCPLALERPLPLSATRLRVSARGLSDAHREAAVDRVITAHEMHTTQVRDRMDGRL